MKKFYLTFFMLILCLCAWAQQKESLKITYTNDVGMVDTNYTPTLQPSLFRDATYHKGRILVKFKIDVLNPELIGDKSRHADLSKFITKKAKVIDMEEALTDDITGFRMLTSLSADAKQKWLNNNKNSANPQLLEDVFYLAVVYCKEGDEEKLANKLLKSGLVDYAEPDQIMYLNTPPNDPKYWLQSGWEQPNDVDIDLEIAWQTQTGSPDVKVAILDTGIDYNNDDLGNGTFNTSGANTFSCLIDGKLFSPKQDFFSPKPLTSDYNPNGNSLYIKAYNADNNSAITMYINNIYRGVGVYKFDKSSLLTGADKAFVKYRVDDPLTQNYSTELTGQGNITITRSDNNIVSGTFEFVVQNEENANDKVTFTKGRFDLAVNGIK